MKGCVKEVARSFVLRGGVPRRGCVEGVAMPLAKALLRELSAGTLDVFLQKRCLICLWSISSSPKFRKYGFQTLMSVHGGRKNSENGRMAEMPT